MTASVKYAYTMTLNPRLFKLKANEQLEKIRHLLYDVLSPFKYTLIAEYTMNYNIHFHGILQIADINKHGYLEFKNNPLKFLYDYFRNIPNIGFVHIKAIDDEPGWIEYILKDPVEILHDDHFIAPNYWNELLEQ